MLAGRTLKVVQQTDGGGVERGMEQRAHNHHKGLKSSSEIAEECRWRIARHTLLRTVRFGPLRRAARCNHSDHFSIAAPSSQIGLVGCIQVCMDLASKLLSGAYVGSRRGLKDEGGGIYADVLGKVCSRPCRDQYVPPCE